MRYHDAWETWLEFFLKGIYISARQAIQTAQKINALFEQDMKKIQNLGRVRFSCNKTFGYFGRISTHNF